MLVKNTAYTHSVLLQTYCKLTYFLSLISPIATPNKKSLDLEGWVVGEAVAVNKSYIVSKSVGVSYEIRIIFFLQHFI